MRIIDYCKKRFSEYNVLILGILSAFLIRLALSSLPSFGFDMGSWLGWADRLSSLGFDKFYTEESWTQYTPGFMYWLWTIGKLGWLNEFAVKIPVLLADLATGALIWSLIRKISTKLALAAFFLYVLNPVVVFDGSVWGQIDGLLTLFLFLSAYSIIERRSLILSILAWSIAFLIKPQSIAVLPAMLMLAYVKKIKFRSLLLSGVIGLFTLFLLSWPFFLNDPFFGLPRQILSMGNYYSYTSVFAFNIWSWVGFWKPDSSLFLGISLASWGAYLFGLSVLLALYVFRNKLSGRGSIESEFSKKANQYLLFAILSLCFFVFPTRVHERYLFPFFAFLITSAGLSKSTNLFAVYGIASVASFLNVYYPYSYYYPAQLKSELLYVVSGGLSKIIGFIFLAIYFALLFWEKIPKFKLLPLIVRLTNGRRGGRGKYKFPEMSLGKKTVRVILLGILIFAFIARAFDLGLPKSEYFDEVYHAFTARAVLHGDPKAWEWWNTPPTGFAYEWTHPPLAKLGMFLGMKIFGENSFGWRIPGAVLGVLSVLLVYLLAKILFEDEIAGLLSAMVFSLDGLPLVTSRIGMNDSYILFFSLLSVYLFLKKKDFWSAAAFGFALASKWSAVWVIPILGILWLWRKKRLAPSLLWFLFLPLGIYFLSYLPMFLSNHSISVWWEMQKQMWWYHTGLRATHPYSSPWWSWPFLVRPIYLYTSDEIRGMVSRIYAMGNPVAFWFGVASVFLSSAYAYFEKNKKLGLVVFSYLIFFVPWAASPRIMFLYHYLPSIPFLALATGYVLRRNPKLIPIYLFASLVVFTYFYPHWAGLNIPIWLDKSYYWTGSWR